MIYQGQNYDLSEFFVGPSQRLAKKINHIQTQIVYDLTKWYPEIYDKVTDKKIRAYIIKNNLNKKDLTCKNINCSNIVKFNSPSKGFVSFCCPKCANTDKEIVERREKTNLKNCGYKSNFLAPITHIKKSNTNIKKYGHTNILCSDYGKNKIKISNELKYGDKNKTNNNQHILNFDYWNDIEFIKDNFIKDDFLLSTEFQEFFNCLEYAMYNKLKQLNIIFKKRSCTTAEYDIIKFIDYDFVIHSDRNLINKELDILIPNNFAIEYDGLIYHSHGISSDVKFNNPIENKNRHLVKTELCEEKEIQLFHIFENEWLNINQQNIWKSIINNKLNKNLKIMARKCNIKKIDNKTTYNFLQENHLQGGVYSPINYGLYYNNELVSVMTFGKSRFDKKFQYELIRFCSRININIIGGASKLLKAFERDYKPISLISYANRRWSKGDLYNTIGFIYSHSTPANYFYFNMKNIGLKKLKNERNILESRNKYQKHKLNNILDNFDSELSETQNMYNNNYRKIFDCGNKVYYKIYQGVVNESNLF